MSSRNFSISSDFACWMKVRKLTVLILAVAVGLGSLIVVVAGAEGDGVLSGCCFFTAVRFLVDDGMSGEIKIAGDT